MSLLKDAWDALRKVASLVDRFEQQERQIERLQDQNRELAIRVGVIEEVLRRVPLSGPAEFPAHRAPAATSAKKDAE